MGIDHFFDANAMHAGTIEPDSFYFDAAARKIADERGQGPMFLYVYLGANHFPWRERWRPDLVPEWEDLGNVPDVDEYLRRQRMSERDYGAFVARLRQQFPSESFLIVRYGDHVPDFASPLIEPGIGDALMAERMMTLDPRHFTTYYAVDAVNFRPHGVTDALDTLDAAYLPLVIQELAGVPLDASFSEQKRIFERCRGVFYGCNGGAEARRFNRLLIDAGLIKGL
jgi:hypothetical protein